MRVAGPLAVVLLTCASAAVAETDSPWATIAIPGGWTTVEAVGLTDDDRAHTLVVLTRLLHANPTGASDQEGAMMRRLVEAMSRPATTRDIDAPARAADIPVLFGTEPWSDLLGSRLTAVRLFEALVQDRSAMLLHYGLAGSDAGIQALVAADRELLRWIHRNAPGAMALVGGSLRMEGGSIAVPGGAGAEPLWEALTGASPRQPAAFVQALLARDQGRLAWLFDSLSQLDEARVNAVLGLQAGREGRVRVLYQAFAADTNWAVEARPFLRVQADAWAIVREVMVEAGGIAPPNDAGLWTFVFGRVGLSAPPDVAALGLTGQPVTHDWLARQITSALLRERRDRWEVVLFAQRVFGGAPPGSEAHMAFTLVNFRRYRALVLTLERLGLRDPVAYAGVIRAARHADGMPGARRRDAVIAFQGALQLAARAHWAGTINRESAVAVVTALAHGVGDAPDVPIAVARWLSTVFASALPRLTNPDALTGRTAYEARILQGLAGILDAPGRAALEWEGLDYVVDPAAAEFARLRDARARLASPGLDTAIADPRAFGLADALLALVYATALGDPSGPAFFSRDVAARHDFGFDSPSSQRRAVVPWTLPYEMVGDGGPWRGMGGLIGLDLAMARLALRRLQEQEMPQAPTIGANEAQVMARTVALLSPPHFTDAVRDELAAALRRGRARVNEAAGSPGRLVSLAAEAGVSPWTRGLVPWIAEHEPARLNLVFSRRHLLELGQPAVLPSELDRWGTYAEPVIGCLCTRMPAAEPWERHGGRTETGQMASHSVDLLLRLAEDTGRLGLPAALIPSLMAYAVQDQIHDVVARVPDDWPATVRAVDRLLLTRVEDYVAALAGTVLQPR